MQVDTAFSILMWAAVSKLFGKRIAYSKSYLILQEVYPGPYWQWTVFISYLSTKVYTNFLLYVVQNRRILHSRSSRMCIIVKSCCHPSVIDRRQQSFMYFTSNHLMVLVEMDGCNLKVTQFEWTGSLLGAVHPCTHSSVDFQLCTIAASSLIWFDHHCLDPTDQLPVAPHLNHYQCPHITPETSDWVTKWRTCHCWPLRYSLDKHQEEESCLS